MSDLIQNQQRYTYQFTFFNFCFDQESKQGYYFPWESREPYMSDFRDTDKLYELERYENIQKHFGLRWSQVENWSYNPITDELILVWQNNHRTSKKAVREWLQTLDWGNIIRPLIVKPPKNPFENKLRSSHEKQVVRFMDWIEPKKLNTVRWNLEPMIDRALSRFYKNFLLESLYGRWNKSCYYGAFTTGSYSPSLLRDVEDAIWPTIKDGFVDIHRYRWRSDMASHILFQKLVSLSYMTTFIRDFDFRGLPDEIVQLWDEGYYPSYDGHYYRLHADDGEMVWARARTVDDLDI